jgi:hypothetical protein
VRRRLFGALLAAGLLLVVGFTAAAVASGGSPFGLLGDQPVTAGDTTTGQEALDQTATDETTSAESTTNESSKDESADDEKADEETTTDDTGTSPGDAEHKVTICHHTGSKKHPFHPITVDEHAVPAHTGHGDTVGPCPATTPSTAPAGKPGKPKHSNGKARGADRNGNGHSQRPSKHTGGPDN